MVLANMKPRVVVHPDRMGGVKPHGANRLFVLHTSEGGEGDGSAENLCALFARPGEKPSPSRPGSFYGASYQYALDTDGVFPVVREDVVSYSAPPANGFGIHICFPGKARQTREEWLDFTSRRYIRRCAELLIDRSPELDIPLVRVSSAQVVAGAHGVCEHFTITNAYHKTDHTDVGVNFPWDVLFADITQLQGAGTVTVFGSLIPHNDRLWDSRDPLVAGVPQGARVVGVKNLPTVLIPGRPAGAVGIALNVTATGSDAPGFVSAWGPGAQPPTNFLSYWPGAPAITQRTDVELAADGSFNLFALSATHLIVDVVGFWLPA